MIVSNMTMGLGGFEYRVALHGEWLSARYGSGWASFCADFAGCAAPDLADSETASQCSPTSDVIFLFEWTKLLREQLHHKVSTPFRLPLQQTGPSLIAFVEFLDLCADKKFKILFKSAQ